MFKEITRGPVRLKIWTDGYDDEPLASATYVTVKANVPDEPRVESETDYYVVDGEAGVAYAYAKSLTTRHGSHNHFDFHILVDEFDMAEHGADAVAREYVTETIGEVFAARGLDVRFGNPDRFEEDGLVVSVPLSVEAFEGQQIEGYGLRAATGRPVFCFLAPESMPVQARWLPPLTHVVNYTFGETEAEAVRRFGVMNTENAIIGGWTGEEGLALVRALADHEEYDIAVRVVPDGEASPDAHDPAYEPAALGEVEFGVGDEGYQRVGHSTWANAENEDGVTALEMWEAEA